MFLPVANKDNKSKTELDIEEYKRMKETIINSLLGIGRNF